MKQLTHKIALVTGAGTGIGRSVALAFAHEGAVVVLAGRRLEPLQQVLKEIQTFGGAAIIVPADVTVEADVLQLFERTRQAFGQLDILVNNAGVAIMRPTVELSLDQWRTVLETNLTGAFLCSREALKLMKPRRSGRIINIGSVSAKVPRRHAAAYTASKFGLEGLTRALALDAREDGISVSIIQPGNTSTPAWAGREQAARQEGIMDPAEVARVVLLMAALPPEVNLLDGTILPVSMPFLGRG